jgi:single-stranded DNA-binding protein
VAGNSVELWGRVLGEPELRTTPRGTAVLRITVDAAQQPGGLAMAVVITGEAARRLCTGLRVGTNVRVKGSLTAVRRRLNSGLLETAYEVVAASIVEEDSQRKN